MEGHFADWYAIVALQPNADTLEKRWKAVLSLADSEDRDHLLSLVRAAKKNRSNGSLDKIATAAREHDAAFQTHNCEPELRVLAGAAIVEILTSPSMEADLVALATSTAGFADTSDDQLFQRVRAQAIRYLSNEAVRTRTFKAKIVGTDANDFSTPIDTFIKEATKPAELASHVVTLLKEVTKIHAQSATALQDEIAGLREESSMFWWTFAGYSADMSRPFHTLGLPASCVVAATELARLTAFIPGPRSAPALLDRVLANADSRAMTVGVADAINAVERTWRAQWVTDYLRTGLDELAPILLATSKSLDTDSPTDWISAFTKRTGIGNVALSPPELAFQIYNENILVRAFAKMNA